MNGLRYILGICLLCTLPVEVRAADSTPAQASEIADRLIGSSLEVDRLLRTVSDRQSGEDAASQLRAKMEYLRQTMEQLSRFPLHSAEDARMLERTMRDLMHITQGYIPVVRRLVEVNAYGSEGLMALFQFYKMTGHGATASDREESSLTRACHEWCDSLDDALYTLRRVQDAQAATAAVEELPALLAKVENRSSVLEGMMCGLPAHQKESARIPAARMSRLCNEMRVEVQRIQGQSCYGEPRLAPLLEAGLKAAQR